MSVPSKAPIDATKRQSGAASAPAPAGDDFAVVGVGASAGGLEASKKLLEALPSGADLALILVQHLDPTHESMMVELLASHTKMVVQQAANGMPVAPGNVYVIPPGTNLGLDKGLLRLTPPQERHGARLPFDYLLRSLATAFGPRAVCVVLSGTGADGALGLQAIKQHGGLVLAQDPDEAAYDGMPRNAILTDAVDEVLPVAKIAEHLAHYRWRTPRTPGPRPASGHEASASWLPEIVALLRRKTSHDFTLYKPGTLQRRTERRMAMAAFEPQDMPRYLERLRSDAVELDALAKDLLINVTSFFRDADVFALLSDKIIPDLIAAHPQDEPLRIWVPGCSTGEEAYSLAMILREQITAAKRSIKLQIFASDVDPDAVAVAREGIYPEAIAAQVSPARLAQFFTPEITGFRISSDVRSVVVFTVQDVLFDPPFSRLDMISCRNLMIYLLPEAQGKVLALFHFALREDGILLLGSSETVGNADNRFLVISKAERVYRHVGRGRSVTTSLATRPDEATRLARRPDTDPLANRMAAFAELTRRLALENYAPAAVLITADNECLHFLGPIDRFLKIVPGQPAHDLLGLVRDDVRAKLRAAIQQARQENRRVVLPGGRTQHDGQTVGFSIAAQPVMYGGETLMFICFPADPERAQRQARTAASGDAARVTDLEMELNATRTELQGAIRNLEVAGEDQKAINEEALSINEEFQSTNEELLTSKEELQSLNEELTALNTQLHETLERQRTLSNDLQNVLYSTNVATLFLDTKLNIRFFTPATKLLFNVIPGDVGRPLADLNLLADDDTLLADARTVLLSPEPIEREIEARNGAYFMRRILPYRTQDNGVEGVVITFVDVSERRHIADALQAAKAQAQLANLGKSRFLAAASHDLRQPLQTMVLIQALLARSVTGDRAQNLVARLDETLGAISGMLNALLDINQIEAGIVSPELVDFSLHDLFDRLRAEFSYHAQAKGISFVVMPCSQIIHSDPRLLEQMLRNLLTNAIKFTTRGKVLLGCRRDRGVLQIEVWDTGIGIAENELQSIFEEYHQIGNPARERGLGLGLGLSIVARLGKLLDHPIRVRSRPNFGSIFAILVTLPPTDVRESVVAKVSASQDAAVEDQRIGTILLVEDDADVREFLALSLEAVGHQVAVAANGPAALELTTEGGLQPDLVLLDFNLPNDMNGLQVAAGVRKTLQREVPAIVLTGDISAATLKEIADQNIEHLTKPVREADLISRIQQLLPPTPASPTVMPPMARPPRPTDPVADTAAPVCYIVDDDRNILGVIRRLLEDDGRLVEDFTSCEAFLAAYRPGRPGCLLVDAYLPGMSGLELLMRLRKDGHPLPSIMITGHSDVQMAVQAMKAGALDFIEKPIGGPQLLASVERALAQLQGARNLIVKREAAAHHVAGLTTRQRQIMEMVLAGHPSKNIAADLGISQRTVENHRASIMKKTEVKSLPALARLALAAAWGDGEGPPQQNGPEAFNPRATRDN